MCCWAQPRKVDGWRVSRDQPDQPRPPKNLFFLAFAFAFSQISFKNTDYKVTTNKNRPDAGCTWWCVAMCLGRSASKIVLFLLNSFFLLLRSCVFSFDREIISISMITKTALAGDLRRCRGAKCIRSSMVKLQVDDLSSVDRRILFDSRDTFLRQVVLCGAREQVASPFNPCVQFLCWFHSLLRQKKHEEMMNSLKCHNIFMALRAIN